MAGQCQAEVHRLLGPAATLRLPAGGREHCARGGESVLVPVCTWAPSWTYTATNRLLVQAGASARREDYEYPLRGSKAPETKALIGVFDQFNSLQYHGQGNAVTLGQFVSAINRIPKVVRRSCMPGHAMS